jgi:hypothetical protein
MNAMNTPNPLRFIRQDIQSMHAYAIQDSAGMVKLDATENRFRSRPSCRPSWVPAWVPWRSTATQAPASKT